MLDFFTQPATQTQNGLQIQLGVNPPPSQLYYRYEVSSKVIGTYLVIMPNPPTVYLVYRVPFYKYDPDAVVAEVSLTNSSSQPLDASHAVCAFDLDGQTVATQSLGFGEIMPGQESVVKVLGPKLSQLNAHKVMTVWIYQLAATDGGGNGAPFKWTLPYTLTVKSSVADAELVDQSPVESDVSQYKGVTEPSGPDAVKPPSSSGGPPTQ